MREDLYYFGNYMDPADIPERNPIPCPASTNKMRYIISKLTAHYNVRVVSPGFSRLSGIHKMERVQKDNYEILYLKNRSTGLDYINMRDVLHSLSYLKEYIKCELKRDSKIIIYSIPWQTITVMNALKKRKDIPIRNIIIEIEELYGQGKEIDIIKKFLYNYIETNIFTKANKFIFINDAVKKHVGKSNPQAQGPICYGEYRIISQQHENLKEGHVRLLYSGSIDYERGIMNFLDALVTYSDKYPQKKKILFDICGYFHGKNGETTKKAFYKAIDVLSEKGIRVIFHGLLPEEGLNERIKESDICVSPQLLDSLFGKYSFPSKILKYLTYGKIVFASNIEAINNSSIKDHLFLYDSDFPAEIADRLHELLANLDYIQTQNSDQLIDFLKEKDRDFEIELLELLK